VTQASSVAFQELDVDCEGEDEESIPDTSGILGLISEADEAVWKDAVAAFERKKRDFQKASTDTSMSRAGNAVEQ
jgi:hypothetical protein